MNAPVQPLLDRELALDRVGGDGELLKEIAVLFLETYPEALEEIRDATTRQDAKALERSAHGLKGSVANFGAPTAVESARNLEYMGRDSKLDHAPLELRNLEQTLAALKLELEALT
jgi:HPt (histidine-containing phosphotransfer) domain-containing protein